MLAAERLPKAVLIPKGVPAPLGSAKSPSQVRLALCLAAGVNRHEHDQRRGKTVSLESMVQARPMLAYSLLAYPICCGRQSMGWRLDSVMAGPLGSRAAAAAGQHGSWHGSWLCTPWVAPCCCYQS